MVAAELMVELFICVLEPSRLPSLTYALLHENIRLRMYICLAAMMDIFDSRRHRNCMHLMLAGIVLLIIYVHDVCRIK